MDAFRGAERGMASFRDAAIRILGNLRDRILQEVFRPIEDAIATLFSSARGGSSGGGLLGGLVSGIASLFGGGGSAMSTLPAALSFTGTTFGGGAGAFGKGGVFDDLGPSTPSPAAAWSASPRCSLSPAAPG